MKFNFIFLILLCLPLSAPAVFDENARRYLSAQEIIQSLAVYFVLPAECQKVSDVNGSKLGVNSPITGSPTAPAPSQATVQWISHCVSLANDNFKLQLPTNQEKLRLLVGDILFTELAIPFALDKTFSLWPAEKRTQLISAVVESMLGSDEVIQDFGIIAPVVLRAKLAAWIDARPGLSTFEVIRFLTINLAVRDEFLSY